MAKDKKKKKDKNDEPGPPRFPFLRGILVGLTIGVALGWWFRPSESFRIDELREATELRLSEATDKSRLKGADWAEALAESLRKGVEK